jgi:hypothetical protein
METSTYSFGSLGVSFTPQEVKAGSERFITKDLSGALGTEVARGTFSIDDGLTASDSSPIFTPDSGELSSKFNTNQSLLATGGGQQAEATPPSTRPYIWKYQ